MTWVRLSIASLGPHMQPGSCPLPFLHPKASTGQLLHPFGASSPMCCRGLSHGHIMLWGQSPYGAKSQQEQEATTAAGALSAVSSQLKGPFFPSHGPMELGSAPPQGSAEGREGSTRDRDSSNPQRAAVAPKGQPGQGPPMLRPSPCALLPHAEKPRTFSQRENTFTVKIFTFQFFTNFSSLIYIAFFLGR